MFRYRNLGNIPAQHESFDRKPQFCIESGRRERERYGSSEVKMNQDDGLSKLCWLFSIQEGRDCVYKTTVGSARLTFLLPRLLASSSPCHPTHPCFNPSNHSPVTQHPKPHPVLSNQASSTPKICTHHRARQPSSIRHFNHHKDQ